MLKVAIVGCGKIADSHGDQIRRIEGCKIVAACDHEALMARQFCERYDVGRYFDNLTEMLSEMRPDVVHITTPPQNHYQLGLTCLEAGAHIYVEKPFTVHSHEAESLIRCAIKNGRKLTVGHDEQFGHVGRRMRKLVTAGYLGDGPLHMESYYCYEIESTGYSGALLGDKNHWVRKLPGKLLHNIISHGIARIAEFLPTDSPQVMAYGFVSPLLRSMGETEIIDELRVIIGDGERVTAYFTFSSQMRPSLRQFRIYGSKNGLLLDQEEEMLIKLRGKRSKSYLEKFVPAVIRARQHVGNLSTNLGLFLARDFQMKAGMKYLIESFYKSITNDSPVPIPYREIALTARIMDAIFEQLSRNMPSSCDTRLQTVHGA